MSDLAPSSEIPENLALDSQKLIQAGSSTPGSHTTLLCRQKVVTQQVLLDLIFWVSEHKSISLFMSLICHTVAKTQ